MAQDHVKPDAAALDDALRRLFRNLEGRALPDNLRPDKPANLLDQLLSSPPKRRTRRA